MNNTTLTHEPTKQELALQEDSPEQAIANKIMFVLSHFPIVSPSMLQISLGSGIPTAVWHPVLERLIALKQVYRYTKLVTSPKGRKQEQIHIAKELPTDGDFTEV